MDWEPLPLSTRLWWLFHSIIRILAQKGENGREASLASLFGRKIVEVSRHEIRRHYGRASTMSITQSIILGLVEGMTEFLPVSSTGHLIITSELLGVPQTKNHITYEVIIQLSALLAMMTTYRERFRVKYAALWLKVIVSFLPIGVVGFILKGALKELFTAKVVPLMFIVGGIAFLWVEYHLKNRDPVTCSLDEITYGQAAVIGLVQVFSLIPGTSRAGSTILGASLVGVSRTVSAEFSFILALPVILVSSGYVYISGPPNFFIEGELLPYLVGLVTSYITAWLVMRTFLSFLNRFTFNFFGVYRIVFGLFLQLWLSR